MGKKFLTAVLVLTLAMTLFSCRSKTDEPDAQDVADTIIAACDEISLDLVPVAQDGIDEYIKAKEKDEEKKREKKRKKEEEKRKKEEKEAEEAEDPMNADSTKDTGANSTVGAMTKRYVGKWEQQGIIMSDGNLDTMSGSFCTYIFKADKTYTAKGKDTAGNKINEKGTWKLNADKQIVAGDYTMGIDESGYLLKDTGERDGKGRKMKYAFAKVN